MRGQDHDAPGPNDAKQLFDPFALQGFVDSRVPVYCGGALKAWAKPVVCRGVLAVQIENVIHDQGIKS